MHAEKFQHTFRFGLEFGVEVVAFDAAEAAKAVDAGKFIESIKPVKPVEVPEALKLIADADGAVCESTVADVTVEDGADLFGILNPLESPGLKERP